MNKQNKIIIQCVVVLIAVVIVFAIINNTSKKTPTGFYDTFAGCVTNKGAVMYGLYYCSHCQEEKATFGDSFKFIKYIECTDQANNKLCLDNGVDAFPTWLVGTSTKIIGFEKNKTLQELSDATGCKLPEVK